MKSKMDGVDVTRRFFLLKAAKTGLGTVTQNASSPVGQALHTAYQADGYIRLADGLLNPEDIPRRKALTDYIPRFFKATKGTLKGATKGTAAVVSQIIG